MPIYSYSKNHKGSRKKILRLLSFLLILTGFTILSVSVYPIVSFDFVYGYKFGEVVSPLPIKIRNGKIRSDFSSMLTMTNPDLTRATSWFPEAVSEKTAEEGENTYHLSIPKLQIENAVVSAINEDLSKNLFHFTGPSPGKAGNAVIFGHSSIPFAYDKKNYKTIFTKLPDLKNGDELLIASDNVIYRYKIFEMRIVDPENLSPLDQSYEDSYLTLITCVPPGTYLKRLVVKSRLAAL